MPDLRSDLEALRDRVSDWYALFHRTEVEWIACAIDALLASHPAVPDLREWRGPWKCPKCEAELLYEPRGHYKAHITGRGAIPCDGVMVPYERRKGGA